MIIVKDKVKSEESSSSEEESSIENLDAARQNNKGDKDYGQSAHAVISTT